MNCVFFSSFFFNVILPDVGQKTLMLRRVVELWSFVLTRLPSTKSWLIFNFSHFNTHNSQSSSSCTGRSIILTFLNNGPLPHPQALTGSPSLTGPVCSRQPLPAAVREGAAQPSTSRLQIVHEKSCSLLLPSRM